MTRWPGWDGAVLIALGLAVLGYWLVRGAPGAGHWIALVLALDASYLAATFWWRKWRG